MFEDRTKAHADHVGHGLDRKTTAAVGVLKAIHGGREEGSINRITKDVVAFDAKNFDILSEKLQLDLHEPPISQVIIHILFDSIYKLLNYSVSLGLKMQN